MDAMKTYKIAVLDDYQNAALKSADWSVLGHRTDITVFKDHLADPEAVIERLLPFDVICVMRERSPLPRNIIERLPNLKLIASTGAGNASIDVAAAGDCGIEVVHTGYRSDPTIEFTWALILASARHIATESNSVRSGGWQETVGRRSARKDARRSGTRAYWFRGRANWEGFWNELDCLEPEHDAPGRRSCGRNLGFQEATVRTG